MPDKNQMRVTKKPLRLVIAHVLQCSIGRCIPVFVIFSLLVNINPVSALKSPEAYGEEQCELIAKDYRAVYGGDLIFIQPLKDNGAYDLGDYNGAWINKAWNKNQGTYYIDYQSQTYFQSIEAIQAWYKMMTGKESEVFNVNQEGVPFGLIYYY